MHGSCFTMRFVDVILGIIWEVVKSLLQVYQRFLPRKKLMD